MSTAYTIKSTLAENARTLRANGVAEVPGLLETIGDAVDMNAKILREKATPEVLSDVIDRTMDFEAEFYSENAVAHARSIVKEILENLK